MTIPVKTSAQGDIIESVIAKGDLAKLTPDERNRYYLETCRSLGLNPLTKPFEYITLNGKQVLYARRDAADQLRKIHGISIAIVSQEYADGLFTVHVRAKDRDGREDEDLGVVAMPETMRGEMRANQTLKAVTKAKRRVTLSISGLGLLDETEVADIPAAAKRPAAPATNVMLPPHDAETGEITEEGIYSEEDDLMAYDSKLATAALLGPDALKAEWKKVPKNLKPILKTNLDEVHKPAADEADQAT